MAFSDLASPSGQGRSDASQGMPPVAVLYRLLNGYIIGRAIHVAAQLGVADVLREGPRSTVQIATVVGAHAPTLYRLLRALASVGLFTEVEHGSFALTPLGDCLRIDMPVSLRALASLFGSGMYLQTFDHLLQAVQTGSSPFAPTFGQPFYAYLSQHPDMGALFDVGMGSVSSMVNPVVLAAYDFSSIRDHCRGRRRPGCPAGRDLACQPGHAQHPFRLAVGERQGAGEDRSGGVGRPLRCCGGRHVRRGAGGSRRLPHQERPYGSGRCRGGRGPTELPPGDEQAEPSRSDRPGHPTRRSARAEQVLRPGAAPLH
jgi:hypothetical protein